MLTDRFIQNIEPTEKQKKYAAGEALYLYVHPNGKKVWRLEYRFGGKQRSLAFGHYPQVSLREARQLRDAAKALIKAGIDPATRQTQPAPPVDDVQSLKAICLEWIESEAKNCRPKYRQFMLSGMEKYLFPICGSKPMADVTVDDIIAAVAPLQESGKLRGGRRLTDVWGQVWRYALATGKISQDITTDLPVTVRSKAIGHHMAATVDTSKLGQILLNLEDHQGYVPVGCALRLVPLLFVRSGALRCAEWAEFDLPRKLWIIPASRINLRHDHIVPLAPQALKILRRLYEYTGQRRLLFPSVLRPNEPIDMSTITRALRKSGYDGVKLSFEGIRTLAARILADLGFDDKLINIQLALQERTDIAQKFDSWAQFKERTQMMCKWADYLSMQRNQAFQANAAMNRGGYAD